MPNSIIAIITNIPVRERIQVNCWWIWSSSTTCLRFQGELKMFCLFSNSQFFIYYEKYKTFFHIDTVISTLRDILHTHRTKLHSNCIKNYFAFQLIIIGWGFSWYWEWTTHTGVSANVGLRNETLIALYIMQKPVK